MLVKFLLNFSKFLVLSKLGTNRQLFGQKMQEKTAY
jgi:hypothetical protein